MNTRAQSSAPRERMCVTCCGVRYERWRFVAGPGRRARTEKPFIRNCTECGKGLLWNWAQFEPARRKARKAAAARSRYALNRQRNLELGLTAHGKPRTRVALTSEEAQARRQERAAKRLEQRLAAGRTTRGTVRVYRDRRAKQKAYNAFREQLGPRATWSDVFGGRMENQKEQAA